MLGQRPQNHNSYKVNSVTANVQSWAFCLWRNSWVKGRTANYLKVTVLEQKHYIYNTILLQ